MLLSHCPIDRNSFLTGKNGSKVLRYTANNNHARLNVGSNTLWRYSTKVDERSIYSTKHAKRAVQRDSKSEEGGRALLRLWVKSSGF